MSDPTQAPPVRPMAPDDYAEGHAVAPGRRNVAPGDHPTRDLILAAVVGAAALWAVPKALDAAADWFEDRNGGGLPLEDDDA